jgi:hypothetical protein
MFVNLYVINLPVVIPQYLHISLFPILLRKSQQKIRENMCIDTHSVLQLCCVPALAHQLLKMPFKWLGIYVQLELSHEQQKVL